MGFNWAGATQGLYEGVKSGIVASEGGRNRAHDIALQEDKQVAETERDERLRVATEMRDKTLEKMRADARVKSQTFTADQNTLTRDAQAVQDAATADYRKQVLTGQQEDTRATQENTEAYRSTTRTDKKSAALTKAQGTARRDYLKARQSILNKTDDYENDAAVNRALTDLKTQYAPLMGESVGADLNNDNSIIERAMLEYPGKSRQDVMDALRKWGRIQ